MSRRSRESLSLASGGSSPVKLDDEKSLKSLSLHDGCALSTKCCTDCFCAAVTHQICRNLDNEESLKSLLLDDRCAP